MMKIKDFKLWEIRKVIVILFMSREEVDLENQFDKRLYNKLS